MLNKEDVRGAVLDVTEGNEIRCERGKSILLSLAELYLFGELVRKVSVEEIAKTIHQTREWQALHLEVISDILENVKNGISKAICEKLEGKG